MKNSYRNYNWWRIIIVLTVQLLPVHSTTVTCVNETCENYSYCEWTQWNTIYACLCPTGYSGLYCETNIDDCSPQPCLNGGDCVDGVNQFTCNCTAGYNGSLCETDIDDCLPQPCLNGGDCSDGVNSFTCNCTEGFNGSRCETNIDDCSGSPCANGGICLDGVNQFTCSCALGFEDSLCQTNLDDCSQSPCVNGGTCVDGVNQYTCNCTQGYQGNQCETKIEQKEESLGMGGMVGAAAATGVGVTAASVVLVKGVQLLKSRLGRSGGRAKPGMGRKKKRNNQVKDGDESKENENKKDDDKISVKIPENEKVFPMGIYTDYITAEITLTDKATVMKHTRDLRNVQPVPPKSCPPIQEILK